MGWSRRVDETRLFSIVSILLSAPFIALAIVSHFLLAGICDWLCFAHSLIFLVIIPLILPTYWSLRRRIEWDFPKRSDRIIPFLFVTISYFIGFFSSTIIIRNTMVKYLQLAYALTSLISLVITMRYKISIHIIGIVGPATYLMWTGFIHISAILFLLSIPLGYVRLTLKRHTLDQIIIAYIIAFTANTIAYFIYHSAQH